MADYGDGVPEDELELAEMLAELQSDEEFMDHVDDCPVCSAELEANVAELVDHFATDLDESGLN